MSEEVRTTSSTGGQKGVKPQRHDLLPRPALDRIAEVYAFGAGKYADHNWRLGYEWGKSYAAAQRHLTAFWDGESDDDESGLSHLAHAGFHIFALLTWLSQDGEGVDNPFDDRWTTARARRVLEAEGYDWKAEQEAAIAEGQRIAAIRADLDDALDEVEEVTVLAQDTSGQYEPPVFEDFSALRVMQDKINADVARLAQMTAAPRLFVQDPPVLRVDSGWLDLGWIDETDPNPWTLRPEDAVSVAWRDPAPMTIEFTMNAISNETVRMLVGLPSLNPVTRELQRLAAVLGREIEAKPADQQPVEPTLEEGWVRLGEEDGRVYFVHESTLQPGTLEYENGIALKWVQDYDAEAQHRHPVSTYGRFGQDLEIGPDLPRKRRILNFFRG